MPKERTRELIRDSDSSNYSEFYKIEYDLDEDDRLYETNVDKDVEWVGVGDKGKGVKDDSDELSSFDDSSSKDDGVNEMYEKDTMRVMETSDHSRKDNSSFPQADTRSPTSPTEEIQEANKETLDITEEEIRDTRKETLKKKMEDIRETSTEALETVTMANPNDQLKMQNSDFSFLVERDYSCAENLDLP
ncbi:unnamed protein product [Ilex paraguariensis]|uniref:Uncharacterized protein n=1 Tax=Ilex paraguariensis TaxID=185542 RepID=A0ABC8QRR0_9AQUA